MEYPPSCISVKNHYYEKIIFCYGHAFRLDGYSSTKERKDGCSPTASTSESCQSKGTAPSSAATGTSFSGRSKGYAASATPTTKSKKGSATSSTQGTCRTKRNKEDLITELISWSQAGMGWGVSPNPYKAY